MFKSKYVPEGSFVPIANAGRARMAGLRLVLVCAMLAMLAGMATAPSARGAALEKGISWAEALDPATTGGVPTIRVYFQSGIGVAGLTNRLNYEVTNKTTGAQFGSLTLNPDNITEDTAYPPTPPDPPLVYKLTWNSGEMLNSASVSNGKLTIKNLVDTGGVPLADNLSTNFAGKASLPRANSITCAATATNPTSSTTVSFTVSFSEPVKNVGKSNFQPTMSGISYTDFTVVVDPSDATKYKVGFTGVTATTAAKTGTLTLAFKATQPTPAITDSGGNPLQNSATSPPALSALTATAYIDQVPLQATSTAGPSPTNNPTFTVTFNKDVVGFDDPATDLTIFVDPLKVTYTTALISGSGRNYTVSFVAPRGVGPLSIQVKSTSDLRDARGDGLTATTNGDVVTVDVDTVKPIANYLHTDNPSPTGAREISFVVKFDKNVYDFVPGDLEVLKGAGVVVSDAPVITGDPQDLKNYNVKIKGVSGNGTLALQVKTGDQGALVHDRAGNKLDTSQISNTVVIDNTGPSATEVSIDPPNPTRGGTATFFITFNEPVQNFTASDLVFVKVGALAYNGVSVSGNPATPDTEFTVLIEGVTGEGSLTLSVNTDKNTSKVRDVALNQIVSSVTSIPLVVDNTPPEAEKIELLTASPTNSATVSFMVTFTEPVRFFTNQLDLKVIESPAANVGHEGATITGGPLEYTVDITGVHGDGTITLQASTASDITDLAGNPLVSSVLSFPLTIDQTNPTAAAAPLIKNSATPPVLVTGTVSDNLAVASVSVAVTGYPESYAATLGVGPAAGTWSANITRTLPEGVYDIVVTATDTAGNVAVESTPKALTMDLKPPTVTVTRQITGKTTPVVSATVKDAIGVGAVTFKVDGNTYTAAVAGGNWSAKVTNPLQPLGITQEYDVEVSATDLGGNVGHDTTTNELTFDRDAPSVEVNAIVTQTRMPTLTGTVEYKGSATGIDSVKVSVNGHQLSAALTGSVGVNTLGWSVNWDVELADGIYDVLVEATDNAVPPRPGMDGTTNELTIDNVKPTADFTLQEGSPTSLDVLHAKITFSEPLLVPFSKADMVLTGTLADDVTSFAVSGSDPVYTVTVTMNSSTRITKEKRDGSIGVQVNGALKDKAENLFAGADSPAWFLHHWLGFTSHPQSAPVYSDKSKKFTVTANFGASPAVYTWKWNNGGKSIITVGVDSPELMIDPAAGKAGTYWCEVTYGDPATYQHTYSSNKATLYVADPLKIQEQPKSVTKYFGQDCTFSVIATGGFQPLRYAWSKDDVPIPDAAGSTYSIVKAEKGDSGRYQATVTDVLGSSVASDKATLLVSGEPVPVAGLAGLAALAGVCMFVGCRPKSGSKNKK